MATLTAEKIATLDACLGTYPHTQALKDGAITSDRVALRFNEVELINKAFLMMVRQEKFDVTPMFPNIVTRRASSAPPPART